MTSQIKIAWAAGFLDGEACISVVESTPRDCSRKQFQGVLDVAQAKPEPLQVLVDLFGGRVRPYGRHYYWRLYGPKAAVVLKQVYPYLVVKRQQAELLIEFAATKGVQGRLRSDAIRVRQEEICELFRVLNMRFARHAERLSESAPQSPLRMVR